MPGPDDTLLMEGTAPRTEPVPSLPMSGRATTELSARKCPTCGQHFSGDAGFCPFDGDPLVAAPTYDPRADPLIGRTIDGRYDVEGVLGEGGMGTVYRVRHRALDKAFALKVMRADLARDRDLAARFIQEARAAAAIGHPNIVQITDFGELPHKAPYFVMELLDGEPLSKMLRRGGPIPAGRAVRLLRQMASALSAAHAAGVIHRDLKPDNIHVTKNDLAKILDFGVAKMAGAGRLTRTGMVFGTPHYMSPEQASGEPVDHRADIYALGIIMYEMFTGRVPFEADTYMGVLTKHMFMAPEPPSKVSPAARELGALEDVTLRCLEKKPDARYPSMDALLRDIEEVVRFGAGDSIEVVRPSRLSAAPPRGLLLADELEPPATDELRALRPRGVPTGPSPVVIGGAIVALAVVAGLVAFSVSRSSPPSERPVALVSAASLAPSAAPAPASADPTTAAVPASVAVPESKSAPIAAQTPRKGARTSAPPAGAAPPPKPTAETPKARPTFGGGEIVNPWAN